MVTLVPPARAPLAGVTAVTVMSADAGVTSLQPAVSTAARKMPWIARPLVCAMLTSLRRRRSADAASGCQQSRAPSACAERCYRNWNRRVVEGNAAELAVFIEAPAVGCPRTAESAGVTAARDERAEAQAPDDGDRRRATRDGPVAQLAVAVVAPAVSRSPARQPTSVVGANGEGGEAQAPGDGDGGWAVVRE